MLTLPTTFWTTLSEHFPFFKIATASAEPSEKDALRLLYSNLKEKYPLATEKYWLPRAWQIWGWQPVYVCIFAYYGLKQAIDPREFGIRISGVFSDGFYPKNPTACGLDSFEAMQKALLYFIQAQMQLFDEVFEGRFPHKQAYQYAMDGILGALAMLLNHKVIESPDVTKEWTSLFKVLKTSTIGFNSEKKEYYLELALCCQHFRIDKENLCQGCPKKKNKCEQTLVD